MPLIKSVKPRGVVLPKKGSSAKKFAEKTRRKSFPKREIAQALLVPAHMLTSRQIKILLEAARKGKVNPNHYNVQAAAGMRWAASVKKKGQK